MSAAMDRAVRSSANASRFRTLPQPAIGRLADLSTLHYSSVEEFCRDKIGRARSTFTNLVPN